MCNFYKCTMLHFIFIFKKLLLKNKYFSNSASKENLKMQNIKTIFNKTIKGILKLVYKHLNLSLH